MRASRTMIPLLDLTHSHTALITSSELLMAFFLEAEEEGVAPGLGQPGRRMGPQRRWQRTSRAALDHSDIDNDSNIDSEHDSYIKNDQ